ncbi:hypothetical protein E3U55_01555 [Filobacillus milosensis]|uniref:YcdB/YcdC repeated domain-containing protein n=1 Tax=Filobacillus milosensis TaxID=94137 RepID=A0A4Y8IV50_9BACI|nr:PepSY1/2 domain-containing protein [Filobacillus milosensis]TFB25106.1 hypothetical protein E3U55_01555 [Filobacillus milosensis]
MKLRKVSALILSTSMIFTGIAPTLHAEESGTPQSDSSEEQKRENNQVANEDSVSLEQLIERVKEIFPKYKSAKEEYFRLEFNHRFPGERDYSERYNLVYYDRSQKNPSHISFEFVGEELELNRYYYHPRNESDALFPPKVSEEEAEKLAKEFLKKVDLKGEYELNEQNNSYYFSYNRPLTEPIEYRFSFNKLKDGIPIQNQSISVTVLGNGEITQYRGPRYMGEVDYESTSNLMSKSELLSELKAQINVELQYLIHRDYNTREETAYLTYRETPMIRGLSAKNGQYYVNGEYVDELPESEELKQLPKSSKNPNPLTKDEARSLAEELLATDEEGVELRIDGVMEREVDGIEVYDIRYMYHSQNGGHGSSIQINKNTGELQRFSRARSYNPEEEVDVNVSQEEALDLATDYINKFAFSNMEQYVYPRVSDNVNRDDSPEYHFIFQRIKDGILVSGNYIRVDVSKENGKLLHLSIRHTNVEQWPSLDQVVGEEKALEDIKDKLDLELFYVTEEPYDIRDTEEKVLQYKLSYLRDYDSSFYNAVTGDWKNTRPYGQKDEDQTVSHPWAEEELNFLISNQILEIEGPEQFDGDQVVTRGEALEILTKSIDRVYSGPAPEDAEPTPFENIGHDHPLYNIVMESLRRGILDAEQSTFDVDEKMTRENLAFWYVRALELDSVAKMHDIFNYDFSDEQDISKELKGYVVIADSLGLISKDYKGNILPKQEVTYAQLAVSSLRLAKLLASEEY